MTNGNLLLKDLSIKKIYTSGAITGVEEWSRKYRTEWKKKLEDAGFSVFDPLLDSRDEGERLVKTIVNRDIGRILTCDALILNANKCSWGSGMEIPYARLFKKCIIVIYSKEKVPIWIDYHSDYIFKTIDDFITAIKGEEEKKDENK